MVVISLLLSFLFLAVLGTQGENFESIPLASVEETDAVFHRVSRLQEDIAKELGEDRRDLDDEEEFDSIESTDVEEDDIIDGRAIKARKDKSKSKSKPPAPPIQKSPERKLKGKADDMLPKSKGNEIKRRSLRDSRGLKKRGKAAKKMGKRGKKRQQDWWPYIYSMDMVTLKGHPNGVLREGHPTNTDSCHKVRSIPSALKQQSFYNGGINNFYTKYTEAYGIPVIGSSDVTDEGLKRACYVLRALLASRYDIRYAYYKNFGRIALIGDNEQQTTLYEYSTWDSNYWDNRARGLGPTFSIPISSAGDDNQRCKPGIRYFDQDILVHEASHGVHKVAASLVVEGFEARLGYIYYTNVIKNKMWEGTYASQNVNEYFAVCSQFFFNAFRGPGTYLKKYNVHDRTSLKNYDPDITKLLEEVHPCAVGNDDFIINRCDWKLKGCGMANFQLKYDVKFSAKSNCALKKSVTKHSVEDCAIAACYYEGNVFNFAGSECIIVQCQKTETPTDLKLSQSDGTYLVYTMTTAQPKMSLAAEQAQNIKMHCTAGPTGTSRCSDVVDNIPFGPPGTIKSDCKQMGGCWNGTHCVYPVQDCQDTNVYCHQWARDGECERNPGFMYRKCQLSCGICTWVQELDNDELLNMCQDKDPWCQDWADDGECIDNPNWMNKNCMLSCNICNNVYDINDALQIPVNAYNPKIYKAKP